MTANTIAAPLLACGAAGGARSQDAAAFDAVGPSVRHADDIVGAGSATVVGRRGGRGTKAMRGTGGDAGGGRSVRS